MDITPGSPSPLQPLSDHPLVACWVDELRDPDCAPHRFRQLLARLSSHLALAAASDLQYRRVPGRTPLAECTVTVPDGPVPLVVPVLRAGLSMLDGVLSTVERSRVVAVGVARDEQTLQPRWYLEPHGDLEGAPVLLCDPVLATGGTLCAVGRRLEELGCGPVSVLAVLASPQGVAAVREACPTWSLHVAVVDEDLNGHGYVLPGLGDVGDRWSGCTGAP